MDLTTVASIIGFVFLIFMGVQEGQITSIIINWHGLFVVFGGLSVATALNTPLRLLIKAVKELKNLFIEFSVLNYEETIAAIVRLAEECRRRGFAALKDADPSLAKGFLNRAAITALEYSDARFVRQVLEQEINQTIDERNEVVNVYRTMAVLAPMFGLIGTLLGIIGVLRELSNPENVGPSMAIAITSAFYGILLANIFFVPIAGKIRTRIWMEAKIKAIILEGILEIMKGSIPMVIERRLQSFISEEL